MMPPATAYAELKIKTNVISLEDLAFIPKQSTLGIVSL